MTSSTKPIKIYTIEGKEFTSIGLAKELGIKQNTARSRLLKARTINDLYKPIIDKRKKEKQSYRVGNKHWTCEDIADIVGCANSTAWHRIQTVLKNPTNPKYTEEWLLRPPTVYNVKREELPISSDSKETTDECINYTRMINDDMFKLAMKVI